MKRVTNIGNLPNFLKSFLTHKLFAESTATQVYDCTYKEIIKKAKEEKLEPQVLIDRKGTGKAFLCAVGASIRHDSEANLTTVPPVFYFAELDESRTRQFVKELNAARKKLIEDKKKREAWIDAVKEETQKAGDEIRPSVNDK